MLLCDSDILALLEAMSFATEDAKRPFKPDEQVRPASIDLRLDRCFWIPRKAHGKSISFLGPALGHLDTQRLYRKRWMRLGEGISLKPGELILARTYEIFTLPNGFAGKLEGRSSFARLGLSIHCTGDFINPGWRGRMPLQLVNHGRVPIVITPFMDICQLLIVKTTGESAKPYDAPDLASKYMNEEGEPSRYWMDARIKKLREACGKVDLDAHILAEFERTLGKKDVRILDRFATFLGRLPHGQLTNAQEIIDRFSVAEKNSRDWKTRRQTFFKWLPFFSLSVSISVLLKPPYYWAHWVLWSITAILLVPGFYYMFFAEPPGEYFLDPESEH
ncbi:dCTP deaminase [Tundrisphaera sp. TA3]|uniref:dCTP deaminase n=1 Tax=Tundrisphaera sp. TA3 TaxID=3435775 RepID=UPI003EBB5F23